MPSSKTTRSELIRAMADIGTMLTGPKSIHDRMTSLCEAAVAVLNCNHVSMLELDGDDYRGAFQFGLPAHLGAGFSEFRLPRASPHVQTIETCGDYLLINSTNTRPEMRHIIEHTATRSIIFVPFIFPDGEPLGYLAVCYIDEKTKITRYEAELATAVARLAQAALLREIETRRRREVSQAMLQVADSERRRLSRDIHDDPLQQILGLRIGLEGFREHLDDPQQQASIDSFIEQCRNASGSLREVMLRTHPTASELADLHEVLTAMVDRKEHTHPVTLSFHDERSSDSPSYLVPALNRIAEQAAGNTLRYARASVLNVTLTNESDGTLLIVADDGIGFDRRTVDHTRLGLVSMRERTELLDGSFSIDSSPDSGTVVRAWFPHAEVLDTAEPTNVQIQSEG